MCDAVMAGVASVTPSPPIAPGRREIRVDIALLVYPCGRIATDLRIASHRTDATEETTHCIELMQPVVSGHVLALAHAIGEALGVTLTLVTSTTTEPNRPGGRA